MKEKEEPEFIFQDKFKMVDEDNNLSPDFFYDNQFVVDNYDDIYCLGRSIYKVKYNSKAKEFEVVRHGYGYLQKGRKAYEIKAMVSKD
jgi:hypothetical protein